MAKRDTPTVAWQRSLRDKFTSTEPHATPENMSTAHVEEITYAQAEAIILKYEWLGNMGTTARAFGLFFGAELAGVVCFGHPFGTISNICGKENADKVYWLARGACVHWAHPHSASFLINEACKKFQMPWKNRDGKDQPAKFVFLATADTDAGEIGTVYQASNWSYVGRTSEPTMWKLPTQKMHEAMSYERAIKLAVRTREGRTTDAAGRLCFSVNGKFFYKGDTLPDGSVIAGTEKYPYRIRASYGKTAKDAEAKRKKELLARGFEQVQGNRKHLYVGIYGDARMKRTLRKALTREVLAYPKRVEPSQDAV